MTQHGLVHKGLTSADQAQRLYAKNVEDLIKKQTNLGYADVKFNFACMHLAGWECTLSLCVYTLISMLMTNWLSCLATIRPLLQGPQNNGAL